MQIFKSLWREGEEEGSLHTNNTDAAATIGCDKSQVAGLFSGDSAEAHGGLVFGGSSLSKIESSKGLALPIFGGSSSSEGSCSGNGDLLLGGEDSAESHGGLVTPVFGSSSLSKIESSNGLVSPVFGSSSLSKIESSNGLVSALARLE